MSIGQTAPDIVEVRTYPSMRRAGSKLKFAFRRADWHY